MSLGGDAVILGSELLGTLEAPRGEKINPQVLPQELLLQ